MIDANNCNQRRSRAAAFLVCGGLVSLLTACATPAPSFDYTAFKQSKPASLLVLPPVNNSPDVQATYSVLAQATLPLAEAGYYVLPVSLTDESFRENGLTTPVDIHAVDAKKLKEVFGADAAVYITVTRYGSTYAVVSSDTTVALEAKVVDLRTGQLLWQGKAAASSSENQGSSQGGVIGLLVKAIITQIVNATTDASHRIAGIADQRLLSAGQRNGILYGPRSEKFGKDQ